MEIRKSKKGSVYLIRPRTSRILLCFGVACHIPSCHQHPSCPQLWPRLQDHHPHRTQVIEVWGPQSGLLIAQSFAWGNRGRAANCLRCLDLILAVNVQPVTS